MTAQNINLRSIIDDEVLQSRFYHDDTILDLRKRFAEDQGYEDDYENITFYRLCSEIPDDKLVREMGKMPMSGYNRNQVKNGSYGL